MYISCESEKKNIPTQSELTTVQKVIKTFEIKKNWESTQRFFPFLNLFLEIILKILVYTLSK